MYTSIAPLGLLLAGSVWLVGCTSQPVRENVPPPVFYQPAAQPTPDGPELSLDWPGTYQGVLPCKGCPGIAMAVQLRPDKTASIRERYLNQPATVAPMSTYQGAFYFEPDQPGIITLGPGPGLPVAAKFMLGEGWLDLRDRSSGAPLTADDSYRLRKTDDQPVQ